MAQECPLVAPLVVKDLQSGVVGQTGTVWTISPDCSYTVARQVGLKVSEPHKQGQLNAEQRQRLAGLIGRAELAGIPNQLGGAPQPNARQVTMSYGRTVSALTLPPGGAAEPSQAALSDPHATQVLELMRAIDDMTGR